MSGKKNSAPAQRLLLLAVAAVLLAALGAGSFVGLPQSGLEQDARRDVGDALRLSQSTGETLSALVFYEAAGSEAGGGAASLRLYVNRPGFSFGWFFRGGLSVPQTGIAVYEVEGCAERAYVCRNTEGICRAVFDNGAATETFELDGAAPFALVSGAGQGLLTFCTADGGEVPAERAQLV